ncbi:hypothetical protein D8W77_05660 [Enterobacter hormaechei]|nr:hypothetical protein [Enterobacter hormaechei]EGQ5313906.1 hypothetical protein [Enterobacter hormaechei]EGQ5322818.1 hypothetical protein [Enterobacter hormaechei]MBK2819206.1 hypothetical protein [Enterobacter hormaechei]RTO04776.1 hypothetical protein EKN68_07180 [Enterobacter hormaechei]
MIENMGPDDQLSVRFIKCGKTIILKGDCWRLPERRCFSVQGEKSGNNTENTVLNRSAKNCLFAIRVPLFTTIAFPF